MENILKDETKFTLLGPVEDHDDTAKTEKDFHKYLLDMKNQGLISDDIIKLIRPVGSRRSRMYGLPKVHKENVPLRPILSTVCSTQRPVAEYLKSLLQPVQEKYSNFCTTDSFNFVSEIKSVLTSKNSFMCSYDIKSLFTNIPLKEVTKICADTLYDDENITPPPFCKSVFIKLLEFSTCGVAFSFNDTMYRITDGLGMGNVLSSLLANIYVGYLEQKIFSAHCKYHPELYRRQVNDTFALFRCKEDSVAFFKLLNSISCLEFTMEEEHECKLPFLDILIEREAACFKTSVYRKPTFAGSYQRWTSFSPQSRKISLIEMLVHRAINICSTSTLAHELDEIRKIFKNSGYPAYMIERTIKGKLAKSANGIVFGPKKQPVYIKLPYKGIASERTAKSLRSVVHSTYGTVSLRVILTTNQMLPTTYKDTLPRYQNSNIIYKFKCNRCDSEYVGKSSRRLDDRIKEHVPSVLRSKTVQELKISSRYNLRGKKIISQENNFFIPPPPGMSAIRIHLLENPLCASEYTKDSFKIIGRARTAFQLSTLEAVLINLHKPILCRHKEFVYHCKLFRNFIYK